MIDHVLGRPSVKSRRLQILSVLAFWTAYLYRGHRHGPPFVRFLSKFWTKRLTTWQTVVLTMIYLYVARNFSTLVNLASPEPMANMYDTAYFRATWVLTALDAGFWTAMKIRTKWLRDLASVVFSVFYMIAAEQADEKVRKVRGMLTVEHLRVSWNKGTTPYIRFFQNLLRPRLTRWPPRAIRIPRPAGSDYSEPVSAWLYYDGPLADLRRHDKLILDIPGGGFVAMDPRCNDDKLLTWAVKTGLPVLSLDYKKAPEFPYPYALNECFDVYATLVRSRGRCIGMSGRHVPRIVIVGDSAGGNLATSTTLMIVERTRRLSTARPGGVSDDDSSSSALPLPLPEGLVLFYPGLDMNIGSWMSDEEMSLMKDRRMRGTSKSIVRRKSMQYNDLVGTPHHSDDEDESTPSTTKTRSSDWSSVVAAPAPQERLHPESARTSRRSPSPAGVTTPATPSTSGLQKNPVASHHPQPLRTRLAMSSMISYFNDRVLTPEMMRAMIILYIGPHNRPDFSKDYLLSPVLAPDSLLVHFPKVYFLTGERDPLVDDTVIFSARLRKAKEEAYWAQQQRNGDQGDERPFDDKDVAEVALLPGVSHGFLQFPSIYPPAWGFIDRTAEWFEDIFAHTDQVRRREKRTMARRQQQQQAGRTTHAAGVVARTADANGTTVWGDGDGQYDRHHRRTLTESSADEDRPLEMAMTKANKGKGKAEGTETSREEGGGERRGRNDATEDEGAEEIHGADGRLKKRNGRARNGSTGKVLSMFKLKSSEDLLGRRMQGLAGGLTGRADDE